MGLFNFIKEAGKKLGIGGDDAPMSKLSKELASHDLGTDKVQVEVVNDKVVLKGEVADQSIFEKRSSPLAIRSAFQRSRPAN